MVDHIKNSSGFCVQQNSKLLPLADNDLSVLVHGLEQMLMVGEGGCVGGPGDVGTFCVVSSALL